MTICHKHKTVGKCGQSATLLAYSSPFCLEFKYLQNLDKNPEGAINLNAPFNYKTRN
jgi:hypothetical protein